MKKIILSLFLILGVISYSAPNFIQTKRIEQKNYQVAQDVERVFSIQKAEAEKVTTITYWYGIKEPDAKELNNVLKQDASKDLKHEGSLKLGKAYVEKFSGGNNFLYTIVFMNAKPKEVMTSIAILTPNEIPKNQMNKFVDKELAESETFVK